MAGAYLDADSPRGFRPVQCAARTNSRSARHQAAADVVSEASELRCQVESQKAAYQRLSEAHQRLQKKHAVLQTQSVATSEAFSEKVALLEEDLEMKAGRLRILEQSQQKAKTQFQAQQSEAAKASAALEAALAKLSTAKAHAKGHQAALESTKEQVTSLEGSKSALAERVKHLTEQNREVSEQLSRAEQDLARRRAAVNPTTSLAAQGGEESRSKLAERELLAARYAVQEAVRDMDRSCAERDSLAAELASKARSYHRLEKRWDACDRELSHLRREHGLKIGQVAEMQATNRNCTAKISGLEQRLAQLTHELSSALSGREELVQRVRDSTQGKADVLQRQQQLEYVHRIQELELKLERLAGSETASHPHNFIARTEHQRLVEARVATQAAEAEAQLQTRLNEVRREVQSKVEAEAEEAARLEIRSLKSRLEDAEQEMTKLQERIQDLTERNESASNDLLHAKEEARRAHYAAESVTASQKEAAKELHSVKEAAAQAKAQTADLRSRASRESERADEAEQKRKAAVLENEELSAKLASVGRELQLRKQHEHHSNEELAQQHRDDLVRKVGSLQSQLHEKAGEASALETKCSELRRKLAESEATGESLRAAVDSGKERASESMLVSRTELNEARQQVRDAKLELQKAQDSAAHDRDASRVAAEESVSLRTELENARDGLRSSGQQIKMLEEAVASQKTTASHALEELQKLAAAQKLAEERDQALKGEVLEAKSEASLAKNRAAALDERCQSLTAELKEAAKQRNDAEAEGVTLKIEIAKSQFDSQASGKRLAELAAEVEGQRTRALSASQELQKMQTTLEENGARAALLQAEIADKDRLLTTTAAAHKDREEKLVSELEALRREAQVLSDRLARAESLFEGQREAARLSDREAESEVALFQEKLRRAHAEADAVEQELRLKIRHLADEVEQRQEVLKAEQAERNLQSEAALKSVREEAKAEALILQSVLKQAQEELSRTQRMLDDKISQVDGLADELSKEQTANRKFAKEIGVLERQTEARQQALAAVEVRLEASRSLIASVVAVLRPQLDLPIEVQQALLSASEREQASAVDQLPALIHRYAEKWSTENLLDPIIRQVGHGGQSPLRRSLSLRASAATRLEEILKAMQQAQTEASARGEEISSLTQAVEDAKTEGQRLIEEARSSAIVPLRSELASIRAAAEETQAAYAADVAKLEEAGRSQLDAAMTTANAQIEALQESLEDLEDRCRREAAAKQRLQQELDRALTKGKRGGPPVPEGTPVMGELLRQLQAL